MNKDKLLFIAVQPLPNNWLVSCKKADDDNFQTALDDFGKARFELAGKRRLAFTREPSPRTNAT